jgi:hypothetical protein
MEIDGETGATDHPHSDNPVPVRHSCAGRRLVGPRPDFFGRRRQQGLGRGLPVREQGESGPGPRDLRENRTEDERGPRYGTRIAHSSCKGREESGKYARRHRGYRGTAQVPIDPGRPRWDLSRKCLRSYGGDPGGAEKGAQKGRESAGRLPCPEECPRDEEAGSRICRDRRQAGFVPPRRCRFFGLCRRSSRSRKPLDPFPLPPALPRVSPVSRRTRSGDRPTATALECQCGLRFRTSPRIPPRTSSGTESPRSTPPMRE